MSHCITIVSVLVCLAIILLITFYHCFTGWNIFWLQKKGTKLKPPKHKRKFIGSNTKFSTWVRPGFRESNNFLLISVFTLLLAAYIFSHRIRLPPCSQRRWPYATTTYLEYIAMFILEYIACDGKVSFFFFISLKRYFWEDFGQFISGPMLIPLGPREWRTLLPMFESCVYSWGRWIRSVPLSPQEMGYRWFPNEWHIGKTAFLLIKIAFSI